VERHTDVGGRLRARRIPVFTVNGVPCDTPILGDATNTANTLRLWRAEAPESFALAVFNRGDYYGAVNSKIVSENITKVLYPNDESSQGKALHLEQQFFFVSCLLQEMLRIVRGRKLPLERFHETFALQLIETHFEIVCEINARFRLVNGQHEILDERRAPDRHARLLRGEPPSCARSSPCCARASSRAVTPGCSSRCSTRCSTTITTLPSPTSRPTRSARSGSDAPTTTRRRGPGRRSSTSRARAGSPRTGPSANTATRSGRSRPCRATSSHPTR
jgi:hypothetical protein